MSAFCDFEKIDNVICIRISGELDHHTTADIRSKASKIITENEIRHVIFNLENLNFMDSSGLGMILGRYNEISSLNGEMIVCSVNETIGKMLEMSGVHKIVRIEPSEEKALSSLEVA